ncbi:MAG: sigma factor regulator FecR [Deltaproteobacteria bacterium]|nr:sigma factor regulator FecR [Deltaproteobacteria bacterium]
MNGDLEQRIEVLAQWLYELSYLVVFTGAGVSTESGLPDFRGPDGIWTRQEKGLPPPPMQRPWSEVDPNPAHYAIRALQDLGKLKFLISQNVDNLHLKSGIRPELLAELHGNITKLRCQRCGAIVDREKAESRCSCGGRLVPSVVDFGQPLPEKDLRESYYHSEHCDLFVAVGSSLVVTPAADMPVVALRAGAKLVIINHGETPLDQYAHLRFHESAGEVLPKAVVLLKQKLRG